MAPHDVIREEQELSHHRLTMNTALDLLDKFRKVDPFTNRQVTYGSVTRRRCGGARVIQFLQVGDEDGEVELRIEVFPVMRGEGD